MVGDHLIAVNGLTIVDSDSWGAIGANYEIDAPMPVVVERQATRLARQLRLPRQTADYWASRSGATLLLMRLAQLVCLLAGIVIAFRRPRDADALAASWFLMTCAVFLIALPPRLAIIWRELPFPIRELFWIPHASSITIGPILLVFVTLFPRRPPWATYIQAAAWGLAGVAMASPLNNAIQLVYRGVELRTIGPRSLPLLIVSSVSLVAAVVLSLIHYRRIDDRNERRRLRVVVAGIAIAVLPGFSALVYFWFTGGTNQASGIFGSPAMAIVGVALLAAPLSITYAVLRHRLFDLSFTVRNRIRHRCARWFVNSIGEILLSSWFSRRSACVRTRWTGYSTGVASFSDDGRHGHRRLRQTPPLAEKAIDRRISASGTMPTRCYATWPRRCTAPTASIALLPLSSPRSNRPCTPSSRPCSSTTPPPGSARSLPRRRSTRRPICQTTASSSRWRGILEQPLDTSPDSGKALLRQVSAADRDYIERARIDVLIRIITRDGDLHAFLALGPSDWENLYAEEEYGLLVTIAENLAMLAARSAPARDRHRTSRSVPSAAPFDAGTRVCSTTAGRSSPAPSAHPRGPLPPGPPARRGRHGRGLRGIRPRARPRCGRQGRARTPDRQRWRPRPVRRGSQTRRPPARPSQHRHGL